MHEGAPAVHVRITGEDYSYGYTSNDNDWLDKLHQIANAMEEVK